MIDANDMRLHNLLNGFQASEALHAATELGVPDALTDASLSLEELACATRTLPDPLSRLLRVLEALGVLERDAESLYGLTAMGQRLRSDVEGSWNAWARMIGSPAIRKSWGQLTQAVRAGTTGFELAHGSDIWAYRLKHPRDGALFDAAMRGGTQRLAEPVAQCLGSLDGRHVVDVGGGDGSLLVHLLLAHAGATGTLLEQGVPARRARELFGQHDLLHRASVVEGDFFVDVPTEGDLYLLKFVLHDWDDGRAARILQSCRTAIRTSGDDACLVLIERLLDAPLGARDACFADLNMLVNTGGRERTRQEYETLLEQTGFGLTTCEAASGSLTVLRARPR